MINFSHPPESLKHSHLNLLRKWLKGVITEENCIVGDIYYIFCDDRFLHQINQNFLKHDTYTDIITFSTSENSEIISGEIYISTERVKDNSLKRNQSFIIELSRVIVHGVLHLLGYDDQENDQKTEMRQKEDYYLSLLPQKIS